MTRAFLTPDALDTSQEQCYPINIAPDLLSYVLGAMHELTLPYRWEPHGVVTPEQAAQFFEEKLLSIIVENCFEDGLMPNIVGECDTDIELPNNTLTPIIWTLSQGTFSVFTRDAPTGVITIHEPGRYQATVYGAFEGNTTGVRRLRIVWSDGSAAKQIQAVTGTAVTSFSFTLPFRVVTAPITLTFQALQNSGVTLDLLGTTSTFGPSRFSIVKLI